MQGQCFSGTGSLGPSSLKKKSYSQSCAQLIPTSDKAALFTLSPAVQSLTGRLKSQAGTDVKIKCRQTSSDNTLFLEHGSWRACIFVSKKITRIPLNQNRLTPETGFAVVSIYNLFCHIYISDCSANSSSQILFRVGKSRRYYNAARLQRREV